MNGTNILVIGSTAAGLKLALWEIKRNVFIRATSTGFVCNRKT